MTPIRTSRLVIRNWREGDRELFFRINSDPQVMRFFAFRRGRAEADAFFDDLRGRIARDGHGFTAIEHAGAGRPIGFAGLSRTDIVPSRPPGTVEIGWRLVPEYWGKGYVTEAAGALLAHGFEAMGLDEIVSFAVWNNERSLAVMRRIGMRREPAGDFDHPSVPDTHPHLKRHHFYSLGREEWLAAQDGGRD